MCFAERFAGQPHAYAKLWKHHGAGDVDGHACVPGAGVDGPEKMLMVLGTSAALMLLDTEKSMWKA